MCGGDGVVEVERCQSAGVAATIFVDLAEARDSSVPPSDQIKFCEGCAFIRAVLVFVPTSAAKALENGLAHAHLYARAQRTHIDKGGAT